MNKEIHPWTFTFRLIDNEFELSIGRNWLLIIVACITSAVVITFF